MDRRAFLERVGSALAGVEPIPLPRSFPATPATGDGAADPDRFVAALAANNGMAMIVSARDLAGAVQAIASGESVAGRAVMTDDLEAWRDAVEAGLRAAGVEPIHPQAAAWRDEAATAAMGITSAALAIAATGSLLLVPDAAAPRVASLLPPVHLAVVPVDRLVPGLEEAMAGVAEAARSSSAPVLVTGPSRTSDIEMTTIYGVHGPRVLRVLLVE